MFSIQLENYWERNNGVEFELYQDLHSGDTLGRLYYPHQFEQTTEFSALQQYIGIVHVRPYCGTKAIHFRACASILKFLFARYPNRLKERNDRTQVYLDQLYGLK